MRAPGPYMLRINDDALRRPFSILDAETATIADVLWDEHMGGEPEATGRLLASAFVLHSALVRLLDRYVGLVNTGDCGHWNPEGDAEVIVARAALREVGDDA